MWRHCGQQLYVAILKGLSCEPNDVTSTGKHRDIGDSGFSVTTLVEASHNVEGSELRVETLTKKSRNSEDIFSKFCIFFPKLVKYQFQII